MLAIFKKEFFGFFSSIIGVLVIIIFLVITGLMLWVFNTPYNIYNAAYADLTLFFELAPWVFLFLIPGICMKSFSEEQRHGTLELLLTMPVSLKYLIFGKFLGAFVLSVIAILPSLVYIFCIQNLAATPEDIDYGAMAASYFGLLFLIAVYTAIGIFSSTLSDNQLTAFLIGVVLCLIVFYAFYGISSSGILGSNAFLIEFLSLKYHYNAMMRGVIDSRDLMFFASIWILFMSFTFWRMKSMKN